MESGPRLVGNVDVALLGDMAARMGRSAQSLRWGRGQRCAIPVRSISLAVAWVPLVGIGAAAALLRAVPGKSRSFSSNATALDSGANGPVDSGPRPSI